LKSRNTGSSGTEEKYAKEGRKSFLRVLKSVKLQMNVIPKQDAQDLIYSFYKSM